MCQDLLQFERAILGGFYKGAFKQNTKMDDQESGATVTFTGIKISTLRDDGSSPTLKYPGAVKLITEYDPEVS